MNQNGQEMRINPEELSLLRATFKGNDKLLKLLRKVFLPEIDPNAPIGQQIDLWLSLTEIKNMSSDEAYHHIMIRNGIIGHVEQQLLQLKVLSELEEKSDEEVAVSREKNRTE